jgi:3-hydroxymyristoyl/3-hydroxydecanoyl-(acyl carrier protein) dehydratase
VDKIIQFHPWKEISGWKAVSLEEYNLMDPFGRKGSFPENLAIESAVQMARWLVAKSSDFKSTVFPVSIEAFQFQKNMGMGKKLLVTGQVLNKSNQDLRFNCVIKMDESIVAQGLIGFRQEPLSPYDDPASMESLWKELYG